MKTKQYTIRGIHPKIDKTLREYARRSHRSLNTVTLEALRVGVNIDEHELDMPSKRLNGLQVFLDAPKKKSPFDPNKPLKELYHESIAKKYSS